MRKVWLATVAAVITTPLMGLPAWAAPCVVAPVATYEAAGFSCSVDGVTFSNIIVNATVSGGGTVVLGDFSPFTIGAENGLALNYTALAVAVGSTADVTWTYNVTGANLADAFMSLNGTATGTGGIRLSEVLSPNGVTLTLLGAGETSATFAPIGSLFVSKDQLDFAGTGGTAESSAILNGFSLSTVPIPGALPLLATGLAGLWALRRRKRKSPDATPLGPALA